MALIERRFIANPALFYSLAGGRTITSIGYNDDTGLVTALAEEPVPSAPSEKLSTFEPVLAMIANNPTAQDERHENYGYSQKGKKLRSAPMPRMSRRAARLAVPIDPKLAPTKRTKSRNMKLLQKLAPKPAAKRTVVLNLKGDLTKYALMIEGKVRLNTEEASVHPAYLRKIWKHPEWRPERHYNALRKAEARATKAVPTPSSPKVGKRKRKKDLELFPTPAPV